MGDSYVEAKEVMLEDAFHQILEDKLNRTLGADDRRFEVIALGHGGSGPMAYYQFLYEDGLQFEPDLVILSVFPGNDVRESSDSLDEQFASWSRDIFLRRIVTAKIRFLDRWPSLEWSYLNGVMADRLCDLYISRLDLFQDGLKSEDLISPDIAVYSRQPYPPEWREAWDTTLSMIERIRDLSEKSEARFLLMIAYSAQIKGMLSDRLAPGQPGQWDLSRPSRMITEYCAEQGIDSIDLEPILTAFQEKTGDRYYWKYDAHWNEKGHQVVAEALAERIEDMLSPPPHASTATED